MTPTDHTPSERSTADYVATEYAVVGMTCGHCVASVSEEVTELAGVSGVEIDLATGALRVTSDQSVTREEIRAAVQEAGYELA